MVYAAQNAKAIPDLRGRKIAIFFAFCKIIFAGSCPQGSLFYSFLCENSMRIISALCTLLLCSVLYSSTVQAARPRLVVLISYDQMRGDYPQRFMPFAGKNGFRKLIAGGSSSPLCYYNHASNMTCPGHASLLTGCYPSLTGIVTNDFWDKKTGCYCYCAEDTQYPVEGKSGAKDGRSPLLMQTPTAGDYLLEQRPGSKVAALSLKDRAGILMAGKKAHTVLWFEKKSGGFTTSSYYQKPIWLKELNQKMPFAAYAGKIWKKEISDKSGARDSIQWENNFPGGDKVFPHQIPTANTPEFAEAFLSSPFSVEYLFNASKFAIEHEDLGRDSITDLLAIGVSSTDYTGHLFGPDSREVQEMFRHCDRILADFITYLDLKLGRDQYMIIISSDHGVGPIPELARSFGKIPVDAGRISEKEFTDKVEQYLNTTFAASKKGASWLHIFEPPTLFLNQELLDQTGLAESIIVDSLCAWMLRQPGISLAAPTEQISSGMIPQGWDKQMLEKFRQDIYPDRIGPIMFMTKPYWVWGPKAATHGTPYDYDTHVPLIFYGNGIPKGKTISGRTQPVDIMPTLCNLLGINHGFVHGNILDLTGAAPKTPPPPAPRRP
jgi:predicted AlkP superfamily pyrophosphatase or phosphodiesterase